MSLPWKEAVIRALTEASKPMHYVDISEAIATKNLRDEVDLGATPASTVNATIANSIKLDGASSPFIRVSRGMYALVPKVNGDPSSAGHDISPISTTTPEEEVEETGLINAFGMYWSRENVLWASNPKILGQQQTASDSVDFCGQRGVYLLHDGRDVVYVGRTTEQPLGLRLKQHTIDRLNGRWDRFSWFGVYEVSEKGALENSIAGSFDLEMLIVTMEALLIEGLEPPQNRKRGDDFRAVEFLQVEDPSIQKDRIVQLIDELKNKLQ